MLFIVLENLGTFHAAPIGGGVIELRDAQTRMVAGLVREQRDGWRAQGLDGWETFATIEEAAAAAIRQAEQAAASRAFARR